MKKGDIYYFEASIGICTDKVWLEEGAWLYCFHFPCENTKYWFRELELSFAKRLTQEQ